MNLYPFVLILSILLISGCASSERSSTNQNQSDDNSTTEQIPNDSERDLSEKMILSLSDSYSAFDNEIPQEFKEIKKKEDVEADLTRGYRIQIYSGQNVSDADTIASTFRAWSDTTITGYQAETYTFFKTPYYRVHVGDFHNRDKALNYSKLVKRLFRDAWVVYDTVDPFMVPDDTVKISLSDS